MRVAAHITDSTVYIIVPCSFRELLSSVSPSWQFLLVLYARRYLQTF